MKKLVTIVTVLAVCSIAFGQEFSQTGIDNIRAVKQDVSNPYVRGNSLWIGTNLLEEADNFYQLSYWHPFTQKDILLLDALTWTYEGPMGIHGTSQQFYPGKVSAYGIGVGYQRFHWKKAFTTVKAISFLQQFYDETDTKLQQGYQLNLQLTAGYRIELLWKRVFVEPGYSLRYWPINTNFPESFEQVERGERNYKIEPSLNFGIRF